MVIKVKHIDDSDFTEKALHNIAKDLQSGRLPLPNKKTQVSDDFVPGLRAVIFESGIITWHVQYNVGSYSDGVRPFMRIGQLHDPKADDYLSLPEARKLAADIVELGKKGYNPQDAAMPRLIKELIERGQDWTPTAVRGKIPAKPRK